MLGEVGLAFILDLKETRQGNIKSKQGKGRIFTTENLL